MAVNKVVYGDNALMDLTADTVTAEKLLLGITAHDKSGVNITGTHVCNVEGHNVKLGTVELSSASETMNITNIGFKATHIMLMLTTTSSSTNSRVHTAYSDGTTLHCQYYTGFVLIGATVSTGAVTGTVTFNTDSIYADTGSYTYTFLPGTWTYVAWN